MSTPDREAGAESRAEKATERLISVVVVVSERPEPLGQLYREYSAPIRAMGSAYEFLFVLEPWHGPMAAELRELAAAGEPIRILQAGRSLGEAAQLKLAAGHCAGRLVVTLPAYHRVRPACLPRLVRKLEDADLALACRSPRKDPWINRLQSRVFHALLGPASGRRFRDIACGVRAVRRELLERLPLYGDFGRFLPVLAAQEGYRVVEVDCAQHPGDRRTRVYAPGVYLRRLIDLFGVFFLLRFTYKPLRFFGLVGSVLALGGGAILLVLFFQRLGGQGIANRPLLLLGVLLFTLGVQVVALGLVGELIVHLNVPARLRYRLRERAEKKR